MPGFLRHFNLFFIRNFGAYVVSYSNICATHLFQLFRRYTTEFSMNESVTHHSGPAELTVQTLVEKREPNKNNIV